MDEKKQYQDEIKEKEEKLLEAIQQVEAESGEDIEYPLEWEDLEMIICDIGQVIEIPFNVEMRRGVHEDCYWLQVEYFSEKLDRTVIWDYDFKTTFESEEEFIETLVDLWTRIENWEKKLFT